MRKSVVLLTLLLVGCRNQKLVKAFDAKCNTPCYTGSQSQAGKGICTFGAWHCEDIDSDPVCIGEGRPRELACNGQDNDCDGKLDSYMQGCTTACGSGFIRCISGAWDVCSAKQPVPETCNGKDDDCNGLVDDAITFTDPYCYDGPASTIGQGECRPGFRKCENGVLTCHGEVLPRPETCNQKDDNCNGTVDEGTTSKPKDIVVCVDESGSMGGTITSIQNTTRNWASKYTGRPDLRFALESCPGHDSSEDNMVILRQNLTDVATFNQAMAQLRAGNTGAEPTTDAIYLTADQSNVLGINWTPGSGRVLVVFTDEQAQTGFVNPPVSVQEAADVSADAGLKVVVFAAPLYSGSFDPVTNLPGNRSLNIYMSPSQMESELDTIVNPCQ